MSAEQNVNPQDQELLSAYLDNMLNEAERSALEARLADDVALRAELDGLQATIALIKALPTLKAPRNFTLTPAMVKSRTETGAPEMVKSKTEAGAPQLVKSRTEAGAPQLVKSKTETGRIIRFPISAVMSAAASFVFILVGMILVFGSAIQPNATKAPAPSDEIAYLPTVQPVANQTTFGGGVGGVGYTDEAQMQADNSDDNMQRTMALTPTSDVVLESAVEQENQPPAPTEEAGDALYAVPAMAEMLPSETQMAQDVMPMQPMPTQSLTEVAVVEQGNNQGTMAQSTQENITETSMRQAATTSAPIVMMAMPTMTTDMEMMNTMAEATPFIEDGAMDSATTITSAQQAYATGVVEVMSNVTEPTWEVFATITPQPESIFRDRADSSEINIVPFIGMGLLVIGILIAILLIWRVVRGRAS